MWLDSAHGGPIRELLLWRWQRALIGQLESERESEWPRERGFQMFSDSVITGSASRGAKLTGKKNGV